MSDDTIRDAGSDDVDSADLLGRGLAEVMAPYRPDSEDFTAAVERRVKDGPKGPELEQRRLMRFVASAAAVLPPVLLPQVLSKAGVYATGAAATKVGVKFLPGVIAYPAIILVMVFVTCYAVLRPSTRKVRKERSVEEYDQQLQTWWKHNWWVTGAVAGVMVPLAMFAKFEAIVALVLASMIALVLILSRLAKAGFTSRRIVARLCSGLVSGLLQVSVLAVMVVALEDDHSQETPQNLLPAAWLVLMLATILCDRLGREKAKGKPKPKTEKQVKEKAKADRMAVGVVAVFLVVPFTGLFIYWGWFHGSGLEKAIASRAQAASFLASKFDRSDWDDIAGIVRHLRLDPGPDPELGEAKITFAAEFERLDLENGWDPVNQFFVHELESLGFLSPAHYESYLGSGQDLFERTMLERAATKQLVYHHAFGVSVALATKGITDGDARVLADGFVETVLEDPSMLSFDDLEVACVVVDRLGHGEMIERLRSTVHRRLLEFWSGKPGDRHACFVEYVAKLKRIDRDKSLLEELSPISERRATEHAIALMARFGVPEGIDLLALHAFLLEGARYRVSAGASGRHLLYAAARSHLESWPAYEAARTAEEQRLLQIEEEKGLIGRVFEGLSSYSLFLGALLFSLLCIIVTYRAPAEPDPEPDPEA